VCSSSERDVALAAGYDAHLAKTVHRKRAADSDCDRHDKP
jgi:hypothetical protein